MQPTLDSQIGIYRNFNNSMSQRSVLFILPAATETLHSLRGSQKMNDIFVVCPWNVRGGDPDDEGLTDLN